MNSRGPSGDIAKFAVLGLLSTGPNHGYGLRAVLEGWEAHRWLDLKYSSIYAALHRFEELGFVEVVGEDAERGPNRTTYQLTDAGRHELTVLARRAWSETPKWSMPIDLAVMYLTFDWLGAGILDRGEIETLLEERVGTLNATIEFLRATKEQTLAISDLQPLRALQDAHFEHGIQLLRAELAWTTSTLESVRAGQFDLDAEPPRTRARARKSDRAPIRGDS